MLGKFMRWVFIIYVFMTLKHSPKVSTSALAFFDFLHYHTISVIHESCDSRWVLKDVGGLETALRENVFGQHLALEMLTTALHAYNNRIQPRSKPLVFNFHGWPGGGKGYVAEFLLKYWFRKGEDSRFVRKYVGKLDFPEASKLHQYQERLRVEIEETIAKCSMAIFVFDEVDKMPPKVLDGIKGYLEYYSKYNGYDYRDAIFIFITNNAQHDISNIVLQHFTDGLEREDLNNEHFEHVLKMASFHEEGGFQKTDLIRHHLIDYFVPFLPLQEKHVAQCIEAEMRKLGGNMRVLEAVQNRIIEELTFNSTFSVNGCKGIYEKVSFLIELDRRRERRKKTEF